MASEVPAVMSTRSADDREALARELGRDRFARRRDARRRAVAVVAVAHGALDGGDQVRRRLETERVGVANVQVAHAEAGGLDALRLEDDVADGVAEAVDAARDGDAEATIYSVGWGSRGHYTTAADSFLFWHARCLKRVVLTEHIGHAELGSMTGLGR